jgi:phage baseplate assembly protein W
MAYEQRFNLSNLNPDVAVGIKLPLIGKNGNLFDLSYSTEEQVISNLKNLILTRQGERIMEPLFGTKLQDSLFEQNDSLLKESLENSILQAVAFWLPYITITKLNIETVIAVSDNDREEHGATISMLIAINGRASETPITFLVTTDSVESV